MSETDPLFLMDRQAAEAAQERARSKAVPVSAKTREQKPRDRLDRALRTTDQVLQSGGFCVVVLDQSRESAALGNVLQASVCRSSEHTGLTLALPLTTAPTCDLFKLKQLLPNGRNFDPHEVEGTLFMAVRMLLTPENKQQWRQVHRA